MFVILLFLALFSYIIYRDILNPTFLICLPWIYSFFMLNFIDAYDTNEIYFLYMIFGVLLFQLSYYIFDKSKTGRNKKYSQYMQSLYISNYMIKTFLYAEIMICILYGYYLYQFGMANYIVDMYQSLKLNASEMDFQATGYLWNFIKIFSGAIYYLYLTKRINNKYFVYIQLGIGLLASLYSMGRSSSIMYIIMLMMLYAFSIKGSNIRLFRILISAFIIGITFFAYYGSIKYSYRMEGLDVVDSLSIIFKDLTLYSSGAIVAFSNWADSSSENLYYGDNALRFLYAFANWIGFDIRYNSLVQDFVPISYEYSTNVYTIYHYYASDFGLIYALMIQIILGCIYAYIYKRAKANIPLYIFLYALLTYPLLMQFFQDQYISLTSTWIQYLLFTLFIFKTNIIVSWKCLVNSSKNL